MLWHLWRETGPLEVSELHDQQAEIRKSEEVTIMIYSEVHELIPHIGSPRCTLNRAAIGTFPTFVSHAQDRRL